MQITYKRAMNGRGFEAIFECQGEEVHFGVVDNKGVFMNVFDNGEVLAYGVSLFKSIKANHNNGDLTLTNENGEEVLKVEYRDYDHSTGEFLPIDWEDKEEYQGTDYGDGYFLTKLGAKEFYDDPTPLHFLTKVGAMVEAFQTLADCIEKGEYPKDVYDLMK